MHKTPAAPVDVLNSEREHIRRSRTALGAMRSDTERITDAGADAFSSESLGALRARRLAALADDPSIPPFFGRLDNDAESFHVGRRHIRDEENEPLVIDWRAPMATPFYRATVADPMGVRRRRRFGFSAGSLTSYEDELLLAGEAHDSHILREEIERPRVGPMRDIVATVQPEQDEIVRADLETSICVQGAPGHWQDRRRSTPSRISALHLCRAAAPVRRSRCRAQPCVSRLHQRGASDAR